MQQAWVKWVVFAAVLGSGCGERLCSDGDGQQSFSFEGGLDSFEAFSNVGLGPTATVSASTREATCGGGAIELAFVNASDNTSVGIRRGFELEPGVAYRIEASIDLWSNDTRPGPGGEWRLFATDDVTGGATTQMGVGGTTIHPDGEGWHQWPAQLDVTARNQAGVNVWVVFQITAAVPSSRTYYVDDVELTFEKRS